MKKGKAAGLDGLTSENLKFSPPILVVLCKLFNLYVSHNHIPESFGLSYTVPIPKCDGRKLLTTLGAYLPVQLYLIYSSCVFLIDI
jgi:hypothetical protein